jgi:hypothetical protein
MSEETNTSGGGIARLVGLLGWLAVIGGLALVAYGLYLMFTSEAQNLAAIQMLSSGALTSLRSDCHSQCHHGKGHGRHRQQYCPASGSRWRKWCRCGSNNSCSD